MQLGRDDTVLSLSFFFFSLSVSDKVTFSVPRKKHRCVLCLALMVLALQVILRDDSHSVHTAGSAVHLYLGEHGCFNSGWNEEIFRSTESRFRSACLSGSAELPARLCVCFPQFANASEQHSRPAGGVGACFKTNVHWYQCESPVQVQKYSLHHKWKVIKNITS